MKSAFELAMERFGGPLRNYTPEQKAALADIDSNYESQIVQARFAAQERIGLAADNPDEVKRIQDDLAMEIHSLRERCERKKEELRKSFS